MGSIPTRGSEIFMYIYIFISSLWCRGKARPCVPPLSTQCLQNLAESGERSVLTLDSLSLPTLLCAGYSVKLFFCFLFIYFSTLVFALCTKYCSTIVLGVCLGWKDLKKENVCFFFIPRTIYRYTYLIQ